MLDTHSRKLIQPLFDYIGRKLVQLGVSPNSITVLSLALGILSSILILQGNGKGAVCLLWVSGMLDVLDGTVARLGNDSSGLGAIMDVVFDRIVELSVIIALAATYPESLMPLLLLTSSIVLSMTVFLTAGNVIQNYSEKSFYYQAGLAERTEGFIFFTLMVMLPEMLTTITYIFAGAVIITAFQRFSEIVSILKK